MARALPPVDDALASPVVFTVYPGVAANSPAGAVVGSPASVAVPTSVQCVPSAES